MTKEELVIGQKYKIRRPSIADGNANSYQWSDATLVSISTRLAENDNHVYTLNPC